MITVDNKIYTDFRFRPPTGPLRDLTVWRNRDEISSRIGTEPAAGGAGTNYPDWRADTAEANLGRVIVPGRTSSDPAEVRRVNDELFKLAIREPSVEVAPGVSTHTFFDEEWMRRTLSSSKVVALSIEPGKEQYPTVASDAAYHKVYSTCATFDKFVMITQSALMGPAKSHDPRHIADVARRYPSLRILIGHCAWPYISESLALANTYNNIWLSPDVYWRSAEARTAFQSLKDVPMHRLVFGSGYPLTQPRRGLSDWMVDLGPALLQRVLTTNADELLGSNIRPPKKGAI